MRWQKTKPRKQDGLEPAPPHKLRKARVFQVLVLKFRRTALAPIPEYEVVRDFAEDGAHGDDGKAHPKPVNDPTEHDDDFLSEKWWEG